MSNHRLSLAPGPTPEYELTGKDHAQLRKASNTKAKRLFKTSKVGGLSIPDIARLTVKLYI